MTFYKTIDMDGTSDTCGGRVRWAPQGSPLLGEHLVTHPNGLLPRGPAGRMDRFLVVSEHPTACPRAAWPCRLVSVESTDARTWGHRTWGASVRASMQWLVTGHLPAWRALGPQGREVSDLIAAGCDLPENPDGGTPGKGGNALYRMDTPALRTIRAARTSGREGAWYALWTALPGPGRVDVRHAALGVLMRDLISEECYLELTGPWFRTAGVDHPASESEADSVI